MAEYEVHTVYGIIHNSNITIVVYNDWICVPKLYENKASVKYECNQISLNDQNTPIYAKMKDLDF